jgi:ATP-dependent Clp protease ATP-binding subunit ClpA
VQVKRVIWSAFAEARRQRHDYIGTEHLLALYHDPDDDAAKTLATLGLTYDDAQHLLVEALDKHRAAD